MVQLLNLLLHNPTGRTAQLGPLSEGPSSHQSLLQDCSTPWCWPAPPWNDAEELSPSLSGL